MKYFFLTEGWTYKRVWERGGIWNEIQWRRPPHVKPLSLGMVENDQTLWLFEVEEAVIMVEVIPISDVARSNSNIGQVVLKRLMDSRQVIYTLINAQKIINNLDLKE